MTQPSLFEQGVAHHRAGRLPEAKRHYELVLAREPEHEQATFLSAAILLDAGHASRAAALLEALVLRAPNNPSYFCNLGEAKRRLGDLAGAAAALTQAVVLAPELAQAHFNLGLVTRALGDGELALRAFERAAECKPDDAQIQRGLALELVARGERARAIGHFQCSLVLSPGTAQLWGDYSACLAKLNRLDAALVAAKRAVELEPHSARPLTQLCSVLTAQGRLDEAIHNAEAALRLEPASGASLTALAAALVESGRLSEAASAYQKAIELEPSDRLAHNNLVFLEAFRPGSSAESILAEAQRWAAVHAPAAFLPHAPHPNPPEAERRIRIGYVSSNFNEHCQALFTLPLLKNHDRGAFELFAYDATPQRDQVTQSLRSHFDHFYAIDQLTPEQAAALVREHGIDILVDLTMHMFDSQLRLFAHKPAPVQIAWLAYPGTTGLPSIDYRITDEHLDPPELPPQPYSEESLHLPDTFWCYAPGNDTPAVSRLPAEQNGFITFGCLNSFWKLNQQTLELWAQVLAKLPSSRLLLLAPEGSARHWVLSTLQRAGIAAERVQFRKRRPRQAYLQLYHEVDVCLDALPYNGHTTSLDAFWMGVPVITLVGNTVAGRAGLCQALNLSLPELVATTATEFVNAATRLCSDVTELAELRRGLRQRLSASALMDAPRFTRHLEAQYRDAWRRWCART